MKNPLGFLIEQLNRYGKVAVGETHNESKLHNLVADLTSQLFLDNICLEIPVCNQSSLDNYLLSGDEKELQKLILDQLRLIDVGYPFEERIPPNSKYFEIIRTAYKKLIDVKAIQFNIHSLTPLEINNKSIDKFMARHIPKNGRMLIYAGNMHIRKDAIPFFRRDIYSIKSIKGECSSEIEEFFAKHHRLKIPFAFDFKDDEIGGKFLRLNPDYSKWFDGVLVY